MTLLFASHFQQILSKHESALIYLLRVNPPAIIANLGCNLGTGDRSTPPEASRWVKEQQQEMAQILFIWLHLGACSLAASNYLLS